MNFIKLALAALTVSFLCACTVKSGNFVDKSSFAYPNSNIKALGQTSISKSKSSFIVPPSWTKADVDALYAEALSKYPGADMLINYKADTSVTFPLLPIIWWSTLELQGTAAQMTIGKKDLSGQK